MWLVVLSMLGASKLLIPWPLSPTGIFVVGLTSFIIFILLEKIQRPSWSVIGVMTINAVAVLLCINAHGEITYPQLKLLPVYDNFENIWILLASIEFAIMLVGLLSNILKLKPWRLYAKRRAFYGYSIGIFAQRHRVNVIGCKFGLHGGEAYTPNQTKVSRVQACKT